MHELSIAEQLIELAVRAAQAAGSPHITVLHVRIGELSGVVREALDFSFMIAASGTLAEGARLECDQQPVLIYCPVCADMVAPVSLQLLCCPHCGMASAEIVQGRELELVAIEVEEALAHVAIA
jgi:hydrogenase nickel incorporation protein HypA/HybF